MYHLYNLIEQGDRVRAAAVRRVQSESSTGSMESKRVRLNLTIEVVKTTFDATGSSAPPDPSAASAAAASSSSTPAADEEVSRAAAVGGSGGEGATLQVAGRVVEENQHVKMGAYHTLDLEVNRALTITKESWDAVHLERLGESTDVSQRAEVGAVVLGDGTAAVCLLTGHMTVVRQRIDVPIPRKRKGLPATAADKATARFYVQVYNAVVKLLQLPHCGSSFSHHLVHERFCLRLLVRRSNTAWRQDLDRQRSQTQIPQDSLQLPARPLADGSTAQPEVNAQLKDTKFAREGQLLERFMKQLASDELRAWYGEQHVLLAAARGAIGVLLISDGLFRAADPQRRKKFVELVEEVRAQGGEVAIFSSMHESGRQLNALTGIAAILTYPLDIEVVEEEEAEEANRAKVETA